MTEPLPSRFLTFWQLALAEPLGLKLKVAPTSDRHQLRNHLVMARRYAKPEIAAAIAHLALRSSPIDPHGTIWIINPNAGREGEDEASAR